MAVCEGVGREHRLRCDTAWRQVHEKETGEVDLLTKGDNNAVDDRGLYAGARSLH